MVLMVERAFGAQVVVKVPNSYLGVRARRDFGATYERRAILSSRDLAGRAWGSTIFFSWTTAGGEEVARTVDTLPGMQAEAQEYLPLEEVPAGEPYRMRGVAPPADNLMDRSRHYSVGNFLGSLPHRKYALQGRVLAICF